MQPGVVSLPFISRCRIAFFQQTSNIVFHDYKIYHFKIIFLFSNVFRFFLSSQMCRLGEYFDVSRACRGLFALTFLSDENPSLYLDKSYSLFLCRASYTYVVARMCFYLILRFFYPFSLQQWKALFFSAPHILIFVF